MIRVTRLAIPDVLLIEPDRFGDERGYFVETYRSSVLEEHGFSGSFVQDNQAFTAAKGTLRGLHLQGGADAQAKLVRVIQGAIFDVAVDVRLGSPWYGKGVAVELSAQNLSQMFVPKGFAHGYLTLTEDSEVLYKVSSYYAPKAETGLLWSDPALGVEWPVSPADAILNARDQAWPALADFRSPFRYELGA
jgi:dTDP-4-dehydrorhamnose 3,5-epimerase